MDIMKIALCSDEPYLVNDLCREELERRGYEVLCFGATKSGKEENWAEVARAAALSIKQGECDEGIFFCYTGTGISIAANKIPGIRAALCVDAQTAANARIWNHANVLALSNRLITSDLLKEILSAWFSTPIDPRAQAAVDELNRIDSLR
jgi:ribose 5-phosphate isomerase B